MDIQNGFVQFSDGRIFPDFPDEPAHIILRVADGSQLVDFDVAASLNVGNHPLERRTVKITASVAVINIKFVVQQAIFLSKVTQQGLLIADAHAFSSRLPVKQSILLHFFKVRSLSGGVIRILPQYPSEKHLLSVLKENAIHVPENH